MNLLNCECPSKEFEIVEKGLCFYVKILGFILEDETVVLMIGVMFLVYFIVALYIIYRKCKEKGDKTNVVICSISIFVLIIGLIFERVGNEYCNKRKKEIYNPVRVSCLHLREPFSKFSKLKYPKDWGYINRTKKDWRELENFKHNCFIERSKECNYVFTGLSRIGKSTFLKEEMKNLSYIIYMSFKEVYDPFTENILCDALGIECKNFDEGLSILKKVARNCPKTLVVVEDITDESNQIPHNRRILFDNVRQLHKKIGLPFIFSSSDADFQIILERIRVREASGDVKYVYLQPLHEGELINNSYFKNQIPNRKDLGMMLNYSKGNWDDIHQIIKLYKENGGNITAAIDEYNRYLCKSVLSIFCMEFDCIKLILTYEKPMNLVSINPVLVRKMLDDNILGKIEKDVVALSRFSLKSALSSPHCVLLRNKLPSVSPKMLIKGVGKWTKKEVKEWIDGLDTTDKLVIYFSKMESEEDQ